MQKWILIEQQQPIFMDNLYLSTNLISPKSLLRVNTCVQKSKYKMIQKEDYIERKIIYLFFILTTLSSNTFKFLRKTKLQTQFKTKIHTNGFKGITLKLKPPKKRKKKHTPRKRLKNGLKNIKMDSKL